MKTRVTKIISAVLYALAAVITVGALFPIVVNGSFANVSPVMVLQLIAGLVFVKLTIDLFDRSNTKVYGTRFFAYNIAYILLSGLTFQSEKMVFSMVLQYLQVNVTNETILYVLLAAKLILVAIAALLATMDGDKEKELKEKISAENAIIEENSEEDFENIEQTADVLTDAEVLEETQATKE
ncbi:MAG: hypothetical protein RR902_00010 [Oscillospiraceae bacterium]